MAHRGCDRPLVLLQNGAGAFARVRLVERSHSVIPKYSS